MKKVFLAILATIAVVGMVSCNKDDNGKGGRGRKKITEANIKIDGDFADWAALTDVASAESDADAAYPSLLSMKVAADKSNIYVYLEYEIPEAEVQGTAAPMVIHLNSDNDCTTGGAYWMWAGNENEPVEVDGETQVIPGIDYFIATDEGFLTSDLSAIQEGPADLAVYQFVATVGTDVWAANAVEKKELTSFLEMKGKVSAGVAIVELSIMRSVVNCTRAGNVKIGLVVQNNADWGATGVLPVGQSAGAVEMLEVALP